MARQCVRCLRSMYTSDTYSYAVEPYERDVGYARTLLADDLRRFSESWAWQSEWEPNMCRECDREHDHRQSPGLWFRFKRWWRNR